MIYSVKSLTSKKVALIVVASAVIHLIVGLGLLYTDRDYFITLVMMLVNVILFGYFLPALW